MLDCPVCSRTQVAEDTCPQCGADLKPLVRLAALRTESQQQAPPPEKRHFPILAIATFAVGLAIFPIWQALFPPLPDHLSLYPPLAHQTGYWAVTTVAGKTTETKETMYTVQNGDSYWSIAKKKYGMGEMWKRIRDDNKDRLRRPGRLHAGDVIRLPTVTISPK